MEFVQLVPVHEPGVKLQLFAAPEGDESSHIH